MALRPSHTRTPDRTSKPDHHGRKDLAARFPRAPGRPVVVSSRNVFAVCDLELLTQPGVLLDYEAPHEEPNDHVVNEIGRWLRIKSRQGAAPSASKATKAGRPRAPGPPPRRQPTPHQEEVAATEAGDAAGKLTGAAHRQDQEQRGEPRGPTAPVPAAAPPPSPDSDYEYEIVDDL